jgi:flagellar hook-associated protein FlgK
LNKSGTDAYLDNAIRLGAIGFRTERPVDQIDPITGSLITESVAFEAAIASGAIPIYENTSGASEDYIADGTLSLNGNALGPLTLTNGEVLSAATVKEWLTDEADRLGISDVTIEASNTLIVNEIDPSKTLEINGESISFDPSVTMAEMVDIINASTNDTNVRAEWLSDSSFKLVNTAGHAGENIVLGGTDSTTALNLSTGVYTGRFSISSAEQAEVALTIASGQPSDMGRLGFYTGIYSDQPLNEELAVFVTGTGAVGASITNSRMTAAEDTEQQLPAAPYKINFTAESVYTITDIATDTVVATRVFEFGKPIEYRGTSISFEAKPSKGDEFFVEANSSPAGNNKNLLALMEWSKRPIISGQTLTEAYLDLVTGVGSRSEMTELRQEALQVVYDQAYNSREQASGVNLDDEAANLIRFQQAYQAAAQVVQASQKAFDILMRIS